MHKDWTAHPVPAHINRTSLAAIQEERKRQLEEEKTKVAAKYSMDDEFTLETASRRDYETIRTQLQEDADKKVMAECTFQPKPNKRIMPTDDATVRQNVAQVLREDARLRQTLQAEHDLLKQYEAELHDASDFYSWQDRMRKTLGSVQHSYTCHSSSCADVPSVHAEEGLPRGRGPDKGAHHPDAAGKRCCCRSTRSNNKDEDHPS